VSVFDDMDDPDQIRSHLADWRACVADPERAKDVFGLHQSRQIVARLERKLIELEVGMRDVRIRLEPRKGEEVSAFLMRANEAAREAQDFRISYDACIAALDALLSQEFFIGQSASLNLQEVFRVALSEIKAAVDHPELYPGTERVKAWVAWVIEQVDLEREGKPIQDPFLMPTGADPEPIRDPADAFGVRITDGTLGWVGDREIGPGHVVMSEERYRWLFAPAGLPVDSLPEVAE
jgi:hypothetical protein